jgi:hypothetical protein
MTRRPRMLSLLLEERSLSSRVYCLCLGTMTVLLPSSATRSLIKASHLFRQPYNLCAYVSPEARCRKDEFHESLVCPRPRAGNARSRCRFLSITIDIPAPVRQQIKLSTLTLPIANQSDYLIHVNPSRKRTLSVCASCRELLQFIRRRALMVFQKGVF